jgi:general L-amino acid transport system substrate-binding protein
MSRKLFPVLALLVILALLLVSCGQQKVIETVVETVEVIKTVVVTVEAPGAAPAAPVEVVKTVVVTVEVPGATPAAPAPVAPAGFGETLKAVQARGKLICGVNSQVPGFGFLDPQGNFSGLDVDFCRVLAAAIFGDITKVEFRPVTAQERFTALQTGEIDVLIRNTTWSLSRDTELATNFVATTFYDGQGMMVRTDSGITDLKGLDGGTICVLKGTTTEQNLADQMAANGVTYTPLVFENPDEVAGAYDEGRCDGYTADKSQLVARKTALKAPDEHIILDVTMSKEPLGPAVRHGDDQWYDIVQWSVFATFLGEEYNLTSANIDEIKASTQDPNIKKILGLEGDMGLKLGLTNDWAYNIIKLMGNYAEIYDKNLGPDTPFKLPRGLNELYLNGGLLYAPPVR